MTCLLAAILVLLHFTTSLADGAAELVKNGSFEADVDKDGTADDWRYCSGGPVEKLDVELSRERGHDGEWCQRISCSRFEAGHVMLAQIGQVSVEKGKWYRLSFWIRGEGIERDIVHIALRDTSDWSDLGANYSVAVKDTWRHYSFSFITPRSCAETTRLQFWFSSTGSFSLDDVSVTELSIPPRALNVTKWQGEENLVPNSSFEVGAFGWGTYELGELFGEIDDSTAAHGKASFKMHLSPQTCPIENFDYYEMIHAPVRTLSLTTIGWLELPPSDYVSVSAYLKADREDLPVDLGIVQLLGGRVSSKVEVGTQWRRFTLSARAKGEYCIPLITLDLESAEIDSATLWADAVQIEKGNEPGAYQPRWPVEFGVSSHARGNFFTFGDVVRLSVTLFNVSRDAFDLPLDVAATDFHDKRVMERRVNVHLPPDQTVTQVLDTGLREKGFYRICLDCDVGGKKVKHSVRAAVIEEYPHSDSFFGINHAYKWPVFLELARRIGITWVRDWSLKWDHVEPEKGKFTFDAADIQINRPIRMGFNVLGMLPFPSSNWSSTATEEDWNRHKEYFQRARHRWRTGFMPRDVGEFENYVFASIRHCKDRIAWWEIFNESLHTTYSLPQRCGYEPKDYVMLLAAAYRAAKAAYPKCKVIGGLSGPPGRCYDQYEGIFIEGALQNCDAVSIHHYPGTMPPEYFERDMERFNNLMRQHGGIKPLWLTEFAYYCDDDVDPISFKWPAHSTENERQCAEYIIRYGIIMLATGVEKIFYHIWHTKLNHESAARIFFEYGGYPRKIAAAQAALANVLPAQTKPLKRIEVGEWRRAYVFLAPSGPVAAIWSLNPEVMTLNDDRLIVLDIMGNEVRGQRVPIYNSPAYVLGKGVSPEVVERAVARAVFLPGDL